MLEKEFTFSKETMTEFTKLLDEKRINLLGISDMKKEELLEISHILGLQKIDSKSNEMLRSEIGHLGKLFLAGQVGQIEHYYKMIFF